MLHGQVNMNIRHVLQKVSNHVHYRAYPFFFLTFNPSFSATGVQEGKKNTKEVGQWQLDGFFLL